MSDPLEQLRIKEAMQKAYPSEQIIDAGVIVHGRMIWGLGSKCGFSARLDPLFIAELTLRQGGKYKYMPRFALNKVFPATDEGESLRKKYIRYLAEVNGGRK